MKLKRCSWFWKTTEIFKYRIIAKSYCSVSQSPNEDFVCNPKKNSPHKMFLHKCVLQYVRTLKLNDATLASLGKLKYSNWRPRWQPKVKILNIYLQSTLVISTSVISNNRLSRRKNLVLVITQKSKIRL